MTSAGRGSVEWVEIMWKKRRFGEKCEWKWKKGGRCGIASGIVESVEMQSNLRLELCPRPLSPSIRPLSAIIILTEEEER